MRLYGITIHFIKNAKVYGVYKSFTLVKRIRFLVSVFFRCTASFVTLEPHYYLCQRCKIKWLSALGMRFINLLLPSWFENLFIFYAKQRKIKRIALYFDISDGISIWFDKLNTVDVVGMHLFSSHVFSQFELFL